MGINDLMLEAQAFLAQHGSKPVLEQLKIKRAIVVPYHACTPANAAIGSMAVGERCFFLFYNPNLIEEEQILTVGHELGHTFEWVLTPEGIRDRHLGISHPLLEEFCEWFAHLWVQNPETKQQVRRLLQEIHNKSNVASPET